MTLLPPIQVCVKTATHIISFDKQLKETVVVKHEKDYLMTFTYHSHEKLQTCLNATEQFFLTLNWRIHFRVIIMAQWFSLVMCKTMNTIVDPHKLHNLRDQIIRQVTFLHHQTVRLAKLGPFTFKQLIAFFYLLPCMPIIVGYTVRKIKGSISLTATILQMIHIATPSRRVIMLNGRLVQLLTCSLMQCFKSS